MNNLFKRSAASFALVGALTSSLFGGNAAYIDVRVKYLSGTDNATLGYNSWDADNAKFKAGAKKDLVELYIRVLDEDGEFADKDNSGAPLRNMTISRNGNAVNNFGNGNGAIGETVSNVIQRGVLSSEKSNEKAIANKNAARYTLDYTTHNTVSLMDELHLVAGNLGKGVSVNLLPPATKGLIVRATTKGVMSSVGGVINAKFTNINIAGTGNLSVQTNTFPQVTAGFKLPIKVYASTIASDLASDDTDDTAADGRFTTSLNNKTIIVAAVADYNSSNTTHTYLNQVELNMVDGVASGFIDMNYALPDQNGSHHITGSKYFGTSIGGLGVAFIAYLKDNSDINNKRGLVSLLNGVLRTDKSNLDMDGNDTATDALKVKSGRIVGFNVGKFNTNIPNNVASNYFSDQSQVFIANSEGFMNSIEADRSQAVGITAVDEFGNPGAIGIFISGTAELNSSAYAENKPSKVSVNNKSYYYKYTTPDGNISMTADGIPADDRENSTAQNSIVTGDMNISFALDKNMSTDSLTGITSMELNISDGLSTTAARHSVSVFFNTGQLAGISSADFVVTTLDVVGKTPNDIKGDLRNMIKDVNVTNGVQKLFTENILETDHSNAKLHIRVDGAEDGNVTLILKVLKQDGSIDTTFSAINGSGVGVKSTATKGSIVEINGSLTSSLNIVSVTDGVAGLAGALVDMNFTRPDATSSNYKALIGTTTILTLKGSANNPDSDRSQGQYVDAYVKTTISSKGAEDFVDAVTEKGKPSNAVIDFDFSGDFITQNTGSTQAVITFTQDGGGESNLSAGVSGKPFYLANTIESSKTTNVVKARIPSSGRLSVKLYGVGADDKPNAPASTTNTKYKIKSVHVNGFNISATSRDGNELTKEIEIDMYEKKTITMGAATKKSATKVLIRSIGSASIGDGKAGDKATSLPSAGGNALLKMSNGVSEFAETSKEVKTSKTIGVFTNIYYTLFSKITDLQVLDAYNNVIDMESEALGDNYTLTTSDPECSVVKMNSGDGVEPATIKFNDCAVGEEISVIITVKGSLPENNASNKITFTNIMKASENTEFDVSLDVGSLNYNVANNDVIVKIIGNGNTEAKQATIIVSSDNENAQITIRPIKLLNGNEFTSLVDDGKIANATIEANGNYYVVRSDAKGKITIKVDAIVPKALAKSKKDTPITGSISFDVTLVDLAEPTATVTTTSSKVTVTISDLSLDAVKTKVSIHKDGSEVKSLTGVNGVYTAELAQGSYSAKVYAIDLAGNILDTSYPVLIGSGTAITLEEESAAMLIAKKEYTVTGTFRSHNFGDEKAKNWVYTKADGMSYALLGKTPSDEDIFGFGTEAVEVKLGTENVWYMIRTGEDTFDWALASADGIAYKLKGAKADGSFDFSGRLNLNVSHKDGMLTFTAK